MATLYVRDVPDEVYDALRKRADEQGRSISAEALRLLQTVLSDTKDKEVRWQEHLAALERIKRRSEATVLRPDHIDSVELLREARAR